MKKLAILLSLIFIFFMFGCTQFIKQYAEQYKNELNASSQKALFDYDALEACPVGNCTCFICDSKKSIIEVVIGKLINGSWRSLQDGNCSFVKECTAEKFEEFWQSDSQAVRMFMIGQGSTFVDFNDANPYCKDRLNLAVKWLVAKEPADPKLAFEYNIPKKERAQCFLSYDVMPMYILYSKGKSISAEQAGKIAEELKGIGPVIITTEIDFNSSDPSTLQNITEQIIKIDEGCRDGEDRKCLIALAPKIGDYDAVNKIFEDEWVKEKVDLIAYGINTRYSNTTCNPAALFLEAVEFSKFTLYNHTKPSIVAYMLLEPGENLGKSCKWTESGIANAYKYFFVYAAPVFVKYGTVGVALYRFNSSEDPLNCPSCRIGENQEYFQNWFSFCQKYKMDVENSPRGDMYAVFSNASAGSCGFATNMQYLANIPFAQKDFTMATVPKMDPKADTAFRCEWCVNNETEWPDDLEVDKAGKPPEGACTNYTELTYYADLYDLDEMFMRAIAWQETAFHHCAVSEVGIDRKCNPKDLRNNPNDKEEDENGEEFVKPFIRDSSNEFCSELMVSGIKGKTVPSAGNKFCAYGLMQVIIYPGEVYKIYEEKRKPLITLTGFEAGAIRDCVGDVSYYNPFNSSQSACVGAYELKEHRDYYIDYIVRPNACALELCDANNKPDENKVRIVAMYLAAHRYYGDVDFSNWADDFVIMKHAKLEDCDPTAPMAHCICDEEGNCKLAQCAGIKNFIEFVRCIIEDKAITGPGEKKPMDYGYRVLSKYRSLIDECTPLEKTGCPPNTYITIAAKKGEKTPE